MSYQFLFYFMQVLATSCFSFIYTLLIRFRRPALFVLLFICLSISGLALRVLTGQMLVVPELILAALTYIALPVLLSSESKLRALAMGGLLFALSSASDPLMSATWFYLSGTNTMPTVITEETVIPMLGTYAVGIFAIMCIGMLAFLAINRKRAPLSTKGSSVIALFIALQAVLLVGIFHIANTYASGTAHVVILTVALTALTIFDIALIQSKQIHVKAQEKLLRLEMLENEYASLEPYAKTADVQLEMLHRLRHDIANHVSTIEHLTSEGRFDDAQNNLSELIQLISASEAAASEEASNA